MYARRHPRLLGNLLTFQLSDFGVAFCKCSLQLSDFGRVDFVPFVLVFKTLDFAIQAFALMRKIVGHSPLIVKCRTELFMQALLLTLQVRDS